MISDDVLTYHALAISASVLPKNDAHLPSIHLFRGIHLAMKKKHLTAMPDDLAAARQHIGQVRATISQLLDDADIAKGKTWKRLNKIYQALDEAEHDLSRAQDELEDMLPKLLKKLDKKKT